MTRQELIKLVVQGARDNLCMTAEQYATGEKNRYLCNALHRSVHALYDERLVEYPLLSDVHEAIWKRIDAAIYGFSTYEIYRRDVLGLIDLSSPWNTKEDQFARIQNERLEILNRIEKEMLE